MRPLAIPAVIPAAGLGTRFLPATKTVPKELIPVVDAAPGKDGVVAHFAEDLELEGTLIGAGKSALLDRVRRSSALFEVQSAIQDRPLGLGHAVGCAEPLLTADDDVVAVLLPDDLVLGHDTMERMVGVRERRGGSVLCAMPVPDDELDAYGVVGVSETDDDGVFRVTSIVEKPGRADAPSNLAVIGRYLLDRAVFRALEQIEPGRGGELQLTDAIGLLIDRGHPVHVVTHPGVRHDLGNPAGMLRAAVDLALGRDDYGPGLRDWLLDPLDAVPRRASVHR